MITESRRLALFESARTSWGEETAQTLMDLLPPDPDQLATKADVALVRADLRAEMADLRAELRAEMADLRAELRAEMAELRGDLRAEMQAAFAEQTRTLMLAMLGMVLTCITFSVGAVIFN